MVVFDHCPLLALRYDFFLDKHVAPLHGFVSPLSVILNNSLTLLYSCTRIYSSQRNCSSEFSLNIVLLTTKDWRVGNSSLLVISQLVNTPFFLLWLSDPILSSSGGGHAEVEWNADQEAHKTGNSAATGDWDE